MPVKIAYGSLDEETLIKGLEERRYDAFFTESKRLIEIRRGHTATARRGGREAAAWLHLLHFRKSDEQLHNDVDKALQTLRSNGTLSKYRSEWFDHNYFGILPDLEP